MLATVGWIGVSFRWPREPPKNCSRLPARPDVVDARGVPGPPQITRARLEEGVTGGPRGTRREGTSRFLSSAGQRNTFATRFRTCRPGRTEPVVFIPGLTACRFFRRAPHPARSGLRSAGGTRALPVLLSRHCPPWRTAWPRPTGLTRTFVNHSRSTRDGKTASPTRPPLPGTHLFSPARPRVRFAGPAAALWC